MQILWKHAESRLFVVLPEMPNDPSDDDNAVFVANEVEVHSLRM